MKRSLKHVIGSLLVIGWLLVSQSATAQVVLTWSFTPTLSGGADTEGVSGSTWAYEATLADTYSAVGAFVGAVSTSVELTISGASNGANNGTFALSELDTTKFAFIPNGAGSALIMRDTNVNSAGYNFGSGGASQVLNQSFVDTTPVLGSAPSLGSVVQASDFNGLEFSNAFNGGPTSGPTAAYGISTTTVTAVVPEPTEYAAIAGALCLGIGIAGARRRRNSAARVASC